MQTVPQSVWEDYAQRQSPELKRDLVLTYLPLVKYVVAKMSVPSAHAASLIRENDLVQYGVIGLLDAIERYNPARGVKFETYAVPRIKGTIQDELRKLDWVPRSVRKKIRLADRIVQHVENNDDVDDICDEIAGKLSLSLEEYRQFVQDTWWSAQEMKRDDDGTLLDNLPSDDKDQLEVLGTEEVKSLLMEMIEHLPERDRLVVTLYYYESLTFKEIATILGISDSRVFQIHSNVLGKLRQKLEGRM